MINKYISLLGLFASLTIFSADKEIHFMDYFKQPKPAKFNFTHTVKANPETGSEKRVNKEVITHYQTFKDTKLTEYYTDKLGTKFTWHNEVKDNKYIVKSFIIKSKTFSNTVKYEPHFMIFSEELLKKKEGTIKIQYSTKVTHEQDGIKTPSTHKYSTQIMFEFLDEYKGYKNVLMKKTFFTVNNVKSTEITYHTLGLGCLFYKYDAKQYSIEFERIKE